MFAPGLVLVVIVLLVAAFLLTLAPWRRGVAVTSVNRFARRQRLHITTRNGGHVVRALAVTFRWRRVGLVLGFWASIAASIPYGRLTIAFVALFLGWFAGAVIAEWRVSALPVAGTRRAASLGRRSLGQYVTRTNRLLLAGVAGLLIASVVGAFARHLATGDGLARWGWAVGFTAVGVLLLALTLRRVVNRPQSAGDPSLLDADDALRGHSLTVLAGSAIAAAGFAVAEFVSQLLPGLGDGVLGFLLLVVVSVVGWWVASRSTSARALTPSGPVPQPATA